MTVGYMPRERMALTGSILSLTRVTWKESRSRAVSNAGIKVEYVRTESSDGRVFRLHRR